MNNRENDDRKDEESGESKKQRTSSPTPASPIPDIHHPNPPQFMVPPSPPKFVSMQEIVKAADGVANMALAHQIAVEGDFEFEPTQPPAGSIEKKVKDIMHKAFWDSLEEKLKEDPPDYSHSLVLLQEIKQNLVELLLPQHNRLRAQIDEVFDGDLLEQKADHGALDFMYYAQFSINLMSKLCAPVRDDQIAALGGIKEVIPLYKEIFSVMDLMKMDMANFQIQQLKPVLQQQSAEYERAKFKDFLKTQQENAIDGLQFTKSWLNRSVVKKVEILRGSTGPAAGSTSPPHPSSGVVTPLGKVSFEDILNPAYVELLEWSDEMPFPETVLMDEGRFIYLQQKTKWLSLVSSILLVTYNTVGAPIAGIQGLKEKLTDQIAAILAGAPESKLKEVMGNVSEHVNKEIQSCLKEHGFREMDTAAQELLKGQIVGTNSTDHAVHKIMKKRILTFIKEVLINTKPSDMRIPPGFSAVASELSQVCGQFLKLVNYNKKVFGPFYIDIIVEQLKKEMSGDDLKGATASASGDQ